MPNMLSRDEKFLSSLVTKT